MAHYGSSTRDEFIKAGYECFGELSQLSHLCKEKETLSHLTGFTSFLILFNIQLVAWGIRCAHLQPLAWVVTLHIISKLLAADWPVSTNSPVSYSTWVVTAGDQMFESLISSSSVSFKKVKHQKAKRYIWRKKWKRKCGYQDTDLQLQYLRIKEDCVDCSHTRKAFFLNTV